MRVTRRTILDGSLHAIRSMTISARPTAATIAAITLILSNALSLHALHLATSPVVAAL
jgi:hypothetical protein